VVHLALTEPEALQLRSILEARLTDLRREISHTDARQYRDLLNDIAATVERLLKPLTSGPAQDADEPERPPMPGAVDHYLRGRVANYVVIHHPLAYTALREAAAAHISQREWAKAVACLADDQPILAVVPADHLVDMQRLRDVVGVVQLRLATEAEIASIYRGCELGAMPPLGPLYGQRVFVDESVTSNDEIAFCAGSHCDAVRMRYQDFARLVRPTVANFGRMH
jgi:Ala-tRNA(Pro) deacylase